MDKLVKLLCLLLMLPTTWAGESSDLFTADRGPQALNHARDNLSSQQIDQFVLGRSFYSKPWVEAPAATRARDGLGPLFNANSCVACHRRNAGGNRVDSTGKVHRSLVIRLNGDPVYGDQLAINAIHGVPFEARVGARIESSEYRYDDGSLIGLIRPHFYLDSLNYGQLHSQTRLSARRAPALVGLGLVERIPARQILEFADPQDRDRDGISGKPNRVQSRQWNRKTLGRFGWKASKPSIIEQTAQALIDDMGLTSPWFPRENCSAAQTQCRDAYRSPVPDVPQHRLQAIAFYLQQLKAPRARSRPAGRALFDQIGCSDCHRSGYRLDDGVQVDPYSDYLLHDMGPALADHSQVGADEPRESTVALDLPTKAVRRLRPRGGRGRQPTADDERENGGQPPTRSHGHIVAATV